MKKNHKQSIALASAVVLTILLSVYLIYRSKLQDLSALALADFEFVHIGITLDKVIEEIGEPTTTGVSMYSYELSDGSQVHLRMPGEKLEGIWVLRTDGTRSNLLTGEEIPVPCLDDFGFLKPGMTLNEVIERIGEPNGQTGSGIPVAIYKLVDERKLILELGTRWTQEQIEVVVMRAWIVSQNGNAVDFFDQ